MKTYKLIKEYPGSPELGTIKDDHDLPMLQSYFTKHPEFWQEIIEKDYEIISEITKYDPKNDYKAVGSRIVSVKRLSDGEVFTVGDRFRATIGGKEVIRTIEKILVEKDELYIFHERGSLSNSRIDGIFNLIQKVKQPIFLTHDGKDIFEGDEVWFVNKENFYYDYIIVSKETKFCSDTRTYFLTREQAEDYIIKNKKLLSIEDFNNAITSQYGNYNVRQKLIQIAKQRLNLK